VVRLKQYLSEKNIIIGIVVVCAILLLLPAGIRHVKYDDIAPGEQAYLHDRIAENFGEADFVRMKYRDDKVFFNRFVKINPHHFLLFGMMKAGIDALIISILFGIMTCLLLYLILKKFNILIEARGFYVLAFVLSPVFVYAFSVPNPHATALFLGMLGFYLLMCQKIIFKIMAVFFLVLASTFSVFHSTLIILLVLAYVIYKRDNKNMIFLGLIILIDGFLMLYYRLPLFLQYTFTENQNYLASMISDLGGKEGFGIFTILLVFIGMFYSWKYKKTFVMRYFFLILIFLLSLKLMLDINIYLNMIVALFAGLGFYKLYKHDWGLLGLKNLFLLIVLCGLVFSTLSYIDRLSNSMPDQEMKEAAEFLFDKEGMVLTHPSYGFFIEDIGDKKVFFDGLGYYSNKDVIGSYENMSTELYFSYDLKKTRAILKNNSIRYIFVTEEMKKGLVWEKENQGLLFLFQNNETFLKVYNNSKVDIYKVI